MLLAAALLVGLQLLWVGTEAGAQQQSCDDHCGALDDTATDLSIGTALNGNLEAAGDIDVFQFTVPAGDTKDLWFYTTGDTDTVGILLDGAGSLSDDSTWLAFSNDSSLAADSNFGFGANVGPGTYYVAVAGADPDTTTGMYSLQSQDLSSPTALTLGTDQSGNLDPGGGVAVFEFEIAAADGVSDVWLYTEGSTDTVGILSDGTGVLAGTSTVLELANDSALADEDNFYLGAILDPGTYYVTVAGADGDAGMYTLKSGKGTDQADEFSASLTPLPPGTPVEGIVGPGGDADVFKLDLSEDSDVVLYTEGDVDTVGTLLDADGDDVAGNNDSSYAAGELNFLLARTLEAGVYYIEVTGYGAGPYRLHYREIGDQSNTRNGAESVTLDSSDLTMGFIGGREDADYFSFTPSSPGVFRVYTVGAADTVGDLQDSEGTSLGENDQVRLSPGHGGFLIERSLSPGTHYISVTGWEDTTGPYRLVVEEVTDAGENTANAAELTPGAAEIGAIGTGGDVDLFKLELDEDTEVVLYSNGPTDTKAELLDSNGDSLTPKVEDDDGGEALNFLILATLDAGTHYIRVEGFNDSITGSYALFAEPVVPVAAFPGLDEEIALGRIQTGHDQGLHKFTLAARAPVWIYTTGLVDTYGTLYDSSFNEIASNDDLGLALLERQFSIRETLGAGTYYVRVSSYGMNMGGYALRVHLVDEPGSTRESANNLGLWAPEPGTIDSGSDTDYFRFRFDENTHNYGSETYFLLHVISAGDVSVQGEIQGSDGSRIEVNWFRYPGGFILAENFGSGTYYVKVTAPSGPTPYTVIILPDSRYANLASDCAEETDKLRHPQTNARLFGDPYYACQWHLKNREPLQLGQDVNIEAAWATTVDGKPVKGEGVNVVVVDDGMDWRHEDLRPNVEASRNHDYGGGNDIYHPYRHHGTQVSGVLAARDNSIGVRGVAPRATIHGHNFLAAQSFFAEADSMVRNGEVTAVSNNSWGPGDVLGFAESFWELAVEKGIRDGYGGKGTFYVFAAGNGAEEGDDANLDEFANFYAVTSVCGVNDRGTRSNFSVKGSSLWVCAAAGDHRGGYRGLVTTDNSHRYRNRTYGTSFSAPIVSGVAALLRQVEPDLTWRDLKLILAASAQKNDPGNEGWDDGALKYGSATERYHFNHEYGFGMADAKAAVDLAQNWDLLPPFQEKQADGTLIPGPKQIPDASTTAREYTATVTDSGMSFIEFVEVKARFQHTSFRDLDIELMSPTGEVSKLVTHSELQELVSLVGEIRLGSSKHLGEHPDGTWTLRVTDQLSNGKSGTLESWEITFYGHSATPGAPRAVSVTPGPERLTVTWEEPEVTRGAITGYDIRHAPTDGGDAAIAENLQFGSGDPLSYLITGLDPRTEYSVQVLARNSAGEGPWSPAVTATTESSGGTDCSAGTVLQGMSASRELTNDCSKLLSVRATLEGQGSLNWSTGLAFANWDGVAYGTPAGAASLRVTGLDLSGEGLTGSIPAEMGGLTGLETLDLSDNGLTGSIPSELGNLEALQTLDLSDNGLSGSIPAALGEQDASTPPQTKLGRLTTLRLKGNELSGEIPAALGNLARLEELDLSNNSLTGAIPAELRGLTSLDVLVLGGNQLSGEIPSGVITMSGLERVDLSDNRLTTGTRGLPAPATTTPSLVSLNLSNNSLSGGIPAGLSNWPGLQELRLSDNSFSGDLPAGLSWGSFSQMSLLDLGDNDLTGAIPPGVRALGTLQKLYLDGNRFEGDITGWGDGLAGLEELFLAQDGKTLTGCIPGGLRRVAKNDLPDLDLPYCDLFLTGLTVEGATLDPAFDPAERERTNYEALAGLARVTVAPTGEPGVSFTYRDESDEEIPDVDPNRPEHQVDLGAGATVVKVVAGSADGKAERAYQIAFRRAGKPGTPTIDPASGVTAGEGRLTVAWTAPSYDGGWDIVSYDLRYIERDARDRVRSDWRVLARVWDTSSGGPLEATIERLVGGVEYSLQVRAFNGSQYSGWSSIVRGTPGAAACGSGAITDPANNRELAADCGVLLAMRDALAGTNGSAPNWSENIPIGNWDGIETAQDGTTQRVTRLELPAAGLDGRIPPTIGRLTGLAALDLSDNSLSGPLPRQLGDLAGLTVLNLGDDPETKGSRNRLTGAIPPSLGRLSRLVTLDLSGNRLTGRIPSYLANPPSLATVDLSGNDLEGRIPSSFSRRDFASLDLSGNELSGSIPALRVLGSLDLSDNQLTGGIPALGGSIGPTTLLDLSNNELTGSLPDTWGAVSGTPPTRKLGTLRVLRLEGNQLSGDIPANLNGMTALTELDLGGNGLSGNIPSMAGLIALEKLHLNDNGLAGPFPTWLPGLASLAEVDLSGNSLTGEIPSELGNLAGLKVLALSDNQLSGQISGKLALKTLEELLLGANGLTGEIPPEVAGLTNLTHLDLSDNRLSGEVPTAWRSTTALEELLLHGNRLTGEIPPGLTGLAGLKVLNLGDNRLDGGIPTGWSSSSSLEIVDLHDNGLTGPIPAGLSNLAELEELRLSENQLSGPIPAGLGSLRNLEQLWLGDNSLTGDIPTELGSLENLEILDLHHNALTGPIPSSFGNLTSLQILFLPFNDLAGEPPDLGALSDLRWLYLFFNRFTGGIPEWIEDLEKLDRLSLSDNDFEGTIPAWLADLPLSLLYLYGNNLSGCIPGELEPLSREIVNDLSVLGLPFCPDTPSRPSVSSIASGELTVLLDVPSDPDGIIDHFEVRYIRRDAPGKANDANWTVERVSPATANYAGPTIHTITGLTDGVRYDIQARWVAGNGQVSPWSPTQVATPGTAPPVTQPEPPPEPPPPSTRPRRGGGGGGGGSPAPAVLPPAEVSAQTLEFTAFVGGEDLPPQLLHLWSPSGTPMTFNVSSNVPWLTVQPASGSSSGPLERMEVAVSVDASQLRPGRHPALIRISGTGFRDSPIEVEVQVTVTSAEFAGTLAPQYDADNNLSIELDEARRAVTHYFEGRIGLEDVLKVVKLYFAG